MTHPKYARRLRAFTIVELLAVMAIISILAALLLPAISRARYHARITQCKSNLRQIGMAITIYSHYFGGWMPVDGDCLDGANAGRIATSIIWNGSIPYTDGSKAHYNGLGLLMMLDQYFLGDPMVLFCPDDMNLELPHQLYRIKNLEADTIAHCSYIYRQLDARTPADARRGKLASLGKNPGFDQASDPLAPSTLEDDMPVRAIVADRNYLGFKDVYFTDPTIRLTHDGSSVNVLFEDGHVETLLNNYPDTPRDLRLNMLSATPPTGTDGLVEQEMDRVWVLYDEGGV